MAALDYVIRDGVLCCCGPLHGKFARCVGSESPFAESLGLVSKRRNRQSTPRQPKPKLRSTAFSIADDVLKSRRRRIRITRQQIQDCPDCTTIHDAAWYCERHRELAVQNVLSASKTDPDLHRCGSLLLLLAERYGVDLTV
jgi:hypothetical protein